MADHSETFEIEAFRSGKWTDSSGNTKEWSDEDLDKIADTYNKSVETGEREAPVVVGHPKDNSPAYGWVESARRMGDRLMLKLKDVQDGFVEALKQRAFKKRSISLFPDMNIRHIGFLGGAQPAVPGLADVQFEENEDVISVEFSMDPDPQTVEEVKRENEFFKRLFQHFGMEIKNRAEDDNTVPSESMEDDMSEELKAQVEELTNKVSEFEATIAEKDSKIEELQNEINAKADEARKAEHKSFCDSLVQEGKLLPANVEMTMENMELRYQADLNTEDGKSLENYKAALSGTEAVVEMTEVATKDKAEEQTEPGVDKFTAAVRKRVAEKSISYSEALKQIQMEQPELAREYAESL